MRYTPCMRLRIASWNVRGMPRPGDQLGLLADQHADIVLLQDVGSSAVRAVADSHVWSSVVDSWSVLPHDSAAPRRGGCLIAAADGWSLRVDLAVSGCSQSPDARLPSLPPTTEVALTILSCYAPTNTGQRQERATCLLQRPGRLLSVIPAPVVLGMDANGPRVDHPDIEQIKWWTEEEALVLGAGARTEDALRLWYADHPAELKRRIRYYPHGPLADSYHRGRKGKYLRSRYDSIRVSPGIRVLDVRYLYDDAIRAGSDHALVVTDIDLPE